MHLLNNEILKHLRLIAIDNVNSHSIEWYQEMAYRHYSKTYHTPLHIVKKELNLAEVVKIFMEDECQQMPPEERLEMKAKLLNLPRPMLDTSAYRLDDVEELSDDEFYEQMVALAEAQEKASAKPPEPKPVDIGAAQKAVKDLYTKLNRPMPATDEGSINFGNE